MHTERPAPPVVLRHVLSADFWQRSDRLLLAETVNSRRLQKAALGRRGSASRTAHRRSCGLTVSATRRPSRRARKSWLSAPYESRFPAASSNEVTCPWSATADAPGPCGIG